MGERREKQAPGRVEILSEFDWNLGGGGGDSARSLTGVSIGVTMRLFCGPLQQSVQEMDACLTLTVSDKLSKRIRSAAIHYI